MTPDLTLGYDAPFDWLGLAEFLGRRGVRGLERATSESYSRTVRLGGVGSITVRPLPERQAIGVACEAGVGPTESLASRVRKLLDLDADSATISSHLASDPLLAESVTLSPGSRVPGAWDGFEIAVRAVLGQQVTVKGAATLCARLVEAYGEPVETGDSALTRLFPAPEVLASADFAEVGLTKTRERTLRELSRAVVDGSLSFDLNVPHEEFLRSMTDLPGIGDWTAHYVAMRARHDRDAFPASDLVLRKAAAQGGTPISERALLRLAERWRPYRAYAAMHLWRSMA